MVIGKSKERIVGGRGMRPIKFRAWDKKFKKMYEGDIRIVLAFPNDDVEIMQFTGLKDKNGREIYEGDIIRTGDAISFVWFGYGKFNEAYYTENYKFDEPMLIDRDLSDFCDYTEVIGNIYENPELLNVPSEKGE